ncbi:MAG TPA: DUF1844 domain-containing protein [Verrucomicrobiae bacterium]|jgi:hypothetical protein|nr:DUF1844 domain-containing protein [Verrucomicrobiae bacterium]
MEYPKDVRFSEKKVDESWKDQVAKDRGEEVPPPPSQSKPAASAPPKPASRPQTQSQVQTSPAFMGLLNSLAYQVMFHLGEIQGPPGAPANVDLAAAREIIELLLALKQKTESHLSAQEADFFNAVLPELQLKFVQHS